MKVQHKSGLLIQNTHSMKSAIHSATKFPTSSSQIALLQVQKYDIIYYYPIVLQKFGCIVQSVVPGLPSIWHHLQYSVSYCSYVLDVAVRTHHFPKYTTVSITLPYEYVQSLKLARDKRAIKSLGE